MKKEINETTKQTREKAMLTADRNRRYRQILEVIDGKRMTVSEIARALFNCGYTDSWHRQVAAPRVTELQQAGVLQVVGETLDERTNRPVAVYEAKQ